MIKLSELQGVWRSLPGGTVVHEFSSIDRETKSRTNIFSTFPNVTMLIEGMNISSSMQNVFGTFLSDYDGYAHVTNVPSFDFSKMQDRYPDINAKRKVFVYFFIDEYKRDFKGNLMQISHAISNPNLGISGTAYWEKI